MQKKFFLEIQTKYKVLISNFHIKRNWKSLIMLVFWGLQKFQLLIVITTWVVVGLLGGGGLIFC